MFDMCLVVAAAALLRSILQGLFTCLPESSTHTHLANGTCLTGVLVRVCVCMSVYCFCCRAAGELVLWGATLWDPRVPAPLHTFDQLSSNSGGAGGVFHPNGGEIILNSEVCGVLVHVCVDG